MGGHDDDLVEPEGVDVTPDRPEDGRGAGPGREPEPPGRRDHRPAGDDEVTPS